LALPWQAPNASRAAAAINPVPMTGFIAPSFDRHSGKNAGANGPNSKKTR
jgi:hypothetical protein